MLHSRFSVVIYFIHSISSVRMSIPVFQFIPVVSWAQFQFCKLKRALETDGVMAAQRFERPKATECDLTMVTMVNFMLRLFYHNF